MIRWLRRMLAGRREEGSRGAGTYTVSGTVSTEAVTRRGSSGPTVIPPAFGHLIVVEGPSRLLSRRFALRDDEVSFGRTEDCYVAIPDQRVSRLHVQIVRDGDRLFVVHRSQTNQTALNGAPLGGRAPLKHGDVIQLADRVRLRFESPETIREGPAPGAAPAPPAPGGLREAMEARVALEDHIALQFLRDGSFLDVDVVDSYNLKSAEERPERVVVSFERFRAMIEGVVAEHGGQVLNSNGDEVMAFFHGADAALAGARAIRARLPGWNRAENRLANDFRVRIGIHTGRSPVDLARGVAYSPVLDGAGHLQKGAPVGGILISHATYTALAVRDGLREHGIVTKDGIEAYVCILEEG
ncbi:MAG TPA: FHA domain-containing protein [Myxococcota bacterium]|nr:FHA domain-containing protein [Myxococcota bacterium]